MNFKSWSCLSILLALAACKTVGGGIAVKVAQGSAVVANDPLGNSILGFVWDHGNNSTNGCSGRRS